MTLAQKAISYLLFFALVLALIALLPNASDYPIPTSFASAVAIIFVYYFQWAGIFWWLNIAWAWYLLSIGFDIAVWIARKVMWIMGFAARLFS